MANQLNKRLVSKPKKSPILFLSHMANIRGGAEKSLLEMIRHLDKNGHDLHIILPDIGSFSEELDKMNIPYSVIYMHWWARSPGDDSGFDFTNPDHANSLVSQIISLIDVLHPRLCVTNSGVVPWLAYAAAITHTRHAWNITEFGASDHGLRYVIDENAVIKTIDTLSDKVFCNSKATADYFTHRFAYNKDVSVIYPFVERRKPRPIASPFKKSAIKLIIVGQIKPQKGQFEAVKAVKRLRNDGWEAQLAIVGAVDVSEYVTKMEDYIKTNQLEKNILWLDFQTNPESYVALADIVLVCSSMEAFGKVTIEGMLQSKPVVGADAAGTAEIITQEKNGLLYRPGDADDLAKQIARLVKDKVLAEHIAKNGRKQALDKFSEEAAYKVFTNYLNHFPPQRSLDLSPLRSMHEDNRLAVAGLRKEVSDRDKIIHSIESSKSWRLIRSVKKLLLK